jgi:hypothetical protein
VVVATACAPPTNYTQGQIDDWVESQQSRATLKSFADWPENVSVASDALRTNTRAVLKLIEQDPSSIEPDLAALGLRYPYIPTASDLGGCLGVRDVDEGLFEGDRTVLDQIAAHLNGAGYKVDYPDRAIAYREPESDAASRPNPGRETVSGRHLRAGGNGPGRTP